MKHFKKVLALSLAVVLLAGAFGCSKKDKTEGNKDTATPVVTVTAPGGIIIAPPTDGTSQATAVVDTTEIPDSSEFPTPTDAPEETLSASPENTELPAETSSARPTVTSAPTKAPTPTPTPTPKPTPTPTPTPVPTPTPEPLPQGDTVSDTDYSLTYYWGPEYADFTEAEVIRMKEAGFDVVPIYTFPWGDMSDGRIHYSHIKECVKLLAKHGLNASVRDGRITQEVEDLSSTRYDIEQGIKKAVAAYADCPNVTEYYLIDEPNAQYFQNLKWAVEVLREVSPNTTAYINLLPNYASSAMWGTDTYEEYVELFAATVNPYYLCTDYYAFRTTGRLNGYAQNLEVLKNVAEKYGLETRVILLVSQHMHFTNLTAEEISWQANLSLLYGMKQMSWYTYSHPSGDPSSSNELIDVNGNATQHYYDVQEQNKITRVLGNALYNTDVEKVFYTGTYVPGISMYSAYGKLGEIKESKNMLISFYDNDSYVFMMSQHSSGNSESTLTADIVPFMQWLNPATSTWENMSTCPYVNGNTISLGAGEGVLLRR